MCKNIFLDLTDKMKILEYSAINLPLSPSRPSYPSLNTKTNMSMREVLLNIKGILKRLSPQLFSSSETFFPSKLQRKSFSSILLHNLLEEGRAGGCWRKQKLGNSALNLSFTGALLRLSFALFKKHNPYM